MAQYKEIIATIQRPFPGFRFYCGCLVLIAILNLISPSDGRGDTLFTILMNKALQRERIIQPTGGWSYHNGEISYDAYEEQLKFTMNQTENLVMRCLVLNYTNFEDQDILMETTPFNYFLHKDILENISIPLHLSLDNEYKLKCELITITRQKILTQVFHSNVFTITDDSVSFSQGIEHNGIVSFLIYNNRRSSIYILPNTLDISPRTNYLFHETSCKFLSKDEMITTKELEDHIDGVFYNNKVMPQSIQSGIPKKGQDYLWCIIKRRDEGGERWTYIVKEPYLVYSPPETKLEY
ncbi:hypothetical protein WA158_008200 [Blastocystis sp. Blastoise]